MYVATPLIAFTIVYILIQIPKYIKLHKLMKNIPTQYPIENEEE